jgi:lathosterol oxidase
MQLSLRRCERRFLGKEMNMNIAPPWITFPSLFFIVALRYLAVSAALYFPFRKLKGNAHFSPTPNYSVPVGQIGHEIRRSLLSCAIFALSGVLVLEGWRYGILPIYTSVQPMGWAYLALSFFLLVSLHEIYFYFTHRWMHRPSIFPKVHLAHHLSRTPTPFASFSFSPWEAAIEAAAVPLLLLLIPVHYSVLLFFLVFMTVLGTTNHLGFYWSKNDWSENWFFRHWIGPHHHSLHHRNVRGNYGLYVKTLDLLFKTELPANGSKEASPL